MELGIIALVILFAFYFLFFRNKKDVNEALSEAPYKVEAPAVPYVDPLAPTPDPAPEPVTGPTVEPLSVAVATDTGAEQTKKRSSVKKDAKPKAAKPKAEKTDAKPKAKKSKMTVVK